MFTLLGSGAVGRAHQYQHEYEHVHNAVTQHPTHHDPVHGERDNAHCSTCIVLATPIAPVGLQSASIDCVRFVFTVAWVFESRADNRWLVCVQADRGPPSGL